MIPVKNEETSEVINIAETWDEIYWQTYVELEKLEKMELDHYQKIVRQLSLLSDNPDKCREWLGKMPVQQFDELCSLIKLPDIDKVKTSNKKFITIDNRKYKIVLNYDKDFTMDEMSVYESLKGRYKGTEDYLLAFGLLLRECDDKGELKEFTAEAFDYVVNNLATKVKTLDMIKHVGFFLRGGKKQSVKTMPAFSILIKK